MIPKASKQPMIIQTDIGTIPPVNTTQQAIIKMAIEDIAKIMNFQSKVYVGRWLYIQANSIKGVLPIL